MSSVGPLGLLDPEVVRIGAEQCNGADYLHEVARSPRASPSPEWKTSQTMHSSVSSASMALRPVLDRGPDSEPRAAPPQHVPAVQHKNAEGMGVQKNPCCEESALAIAVLRKQLDDVKSRNKALEAKNTALQKGLDGAGHKIYELKQQVIRADRHFDELLHHHRLGSSRSLQGHEDTRLLGTNNADAVCEPGVSSIKST